MVRVVEHLRLDLLLLPPSGNQGKHNPEPGCKIDILTFPKNLTLEELDTVFNVGNREHGKYYLDKLPYYLNKGILRRDVEPVPPLYQFDEYQQRAASVAEPGAREENGKGGSGVIA